MPASTALNAVRPVEDRGYIIFALHLVTAALKSVLRPGWAKGDLSRQLVSIGVRAVGVVCLVCICIGLILAMQSSAQMTMMGLESYVPSFVMAMLIKEVSPLLTAIIVVSRSGASVTAELGAMKVADEIEALRVMAIDPIDFLAVPRFWAMVIMMPALTVIGTCVGMFVTWLYCGPVLAMDAAYFIERALADLRPIDVWLTLFKSSLFGSLVVAISCSLGLSVNGGAEGVGKATTKAVSLSVVMILFADLMINTALTLTSSR